MRILITGSEGVLGSTLMRELRRRGYLPHGCDLQHSSDPYVMRADVAEHRQLQRVFQQVRPHLVYHFAAEFGRKNGQEYYEQLWKTNCIGTRNVIDLCTLYGAKLAFASSSEAYGMANAYAGEDRPLKEEDLDIFPPQFHNEYALTKYTNERQITMAVRNQNLDASIFRFFNVYGPPEQYNPYRSVVCLFAYKLLTGNDITVYKNSFRTHLWIGDWANTVANFAKFDPREGGHGRWPGSGGTSCVPVFNIGGRGKESTEHMLQTLQEIVGPQIIPSTITVLEDEKSNVASKEPDNRMAEAWLGHRPTKDFREGLTETVQYLKDVYGL